MNQCRAFISVAIAAFAITFYASAASADTFSRTLSFTDDTKIGSGPFGSVLVTLGNGSSTAIIQFNAAPGYAFGAQTSVDANGDFTLTGIKGNCMSCSYTTGGTSNALGHFTVQVNSGNFSPADRSTEITLDINNTGPAWTSASQVLTANDDGYVAGGHILLLAGAGQRTGFVGALAIPPSVPEPASILLLATVLALTGPLISRSRHN